MFRLGIFILFVLSLFASFTQAQVLETSLSKDTLFYISFPTGKEFQQQFRNSSLGKLLQEAEVQQLLQKFSSLIHPYLLPFNKQLEVLTGKPLFEWLNSFEGEISIAVQKIDRIPEIAFTLGFSEVRIGQTLLENFYSRLQITPEKTEENGFAFETLRIPNGPPIFIGWKQNTLVISFDPEMLKQIVTGTAATSPLTKDPTYQQVSQLIGENKPFRLWINLQKIFEHPLFQQNAPPATKVLLNKLGMDQWTAMNIAGWFEQLDLKFAFQLGTNSLSEPHGFNVIFPNHALPATILNRIPKSSTSVSALHFNFVAFYFQIQQTLREFAPEILNSIQPYLEMLEQDLGVSFEKIHPLSISTYSFISFEDGIGEQSVWCLHPENPQEWLQKILQLFQNRFNIAKKTYRGKEIYQFRVPLGHIERGLANIAPTNIVTAIKEVFALPSSFYVDENRIVMAHLPQTLMDFIDEMDTPSGPPSQVTEVLNAGASSVSWSPVGKNGESTYQTICEIISLFFPLLRSVTHSDISSFDLPRAESILKYARPSFSYTKAGNNMSVSQINLIPTSMPQVGALGVIGVSGVVAAIAIPGLLRARKSANETSAIGNLRSITTAQMQFQMASIIDQDQDGIGEYGWLQELSGTAICRMYKKKVNPPFISSVLGQTAYTSGGIATKNGYHLLMYLPSNSGQAMAEPGYFDGATAKTPEPETINEQEMRFICYAWPVEAGSSGNRCFVVNQTGEVFTCYAAYSGLESIPEPDAALSPGEGSANLQTDLLEGSGNDGNYWSSTY